MRGLLLGLVIVLKGDCFLILSLQRLLPLADAILVEDCVDAVYLYSARYFAFARNVMVSRLGRKDLFSRRLSLPDTGGDEFFLAFLGIELSRLWTYSCYYCFNSTTG